MWLLAETKSVLHKIYLKQFKSTCKQVQIINNVYLQSCLCQTPVPKKWKVSGNSQPKIFERYDLNKG